MGNSLSAFIVSRYPQQRLADFLPTSDQQAWMRDMAKKLRSALNRNDSNSIQTQSSPEGLLYCTIVQQHVPADDVAIDTLHTWTDIFLKEIGHLPLLFYLSLGKTTLDLDASLLDGEVYRVGGPLILIDEDIWIDSRVLRKEFTGSGTAAFFKKSDCIIIREPQNAWVKLLGENLNQLKDTRGRHKLEYVSSEDSLLPADVKKERKQLDNVINFPLPGQRKSLKPSLVPITLQKGERGDTVSRRGYQDVPIGHNKEGIRTVGGRSLLVACNKDANLIAGWRENDPDYEVHNAASLHFLPSVKPGSLPEAMTNGRIKLKNAWITGTYIPPALPDAKQKPNRMIWPQYNLRKVKDIENPEQKP